MSRSAQSSGSPPSRGCTDINDQFVRVDIWLWRARFSKTRSLAAALVEAGAVRLTHNGKQIRLDKPSRVVHPGDEIVFVRDGRVTAVRVEALGERRGPPAEARALYTPLNDEPTASSREPPRGER